MSLSTVSGLLQTDLKISTLSHCLSLNLRLVTSGCTREKGNLVRGGRDVEVAISKDLECAIFLRVFGDRSRRPLNTMWLVYSYINLELKSHFELNST